MENLELQPSLKACRESLEAVELGSNKSWVALDTLFEISEELLSVLQEILAHECIPEMLWTGDANCTTVKNKRLERARKVIAKARGEA